MTVIRVAASLNAGQTLRRLFPVRFRVVDERLESRQGLRPIVRERGMQRILQFGRLGQAVLNGHCAGECVHRLQQCRARFVAKSAFGKDPGQLEFVATQSQTDWWVFSPRISTEYVRPLADWTRKLEKTGCRGSVLVMTNTSSRARWRRLLISSASVVRQSWAGGSLSFWFDLDAFAMGHRERDSTCFVNDELFTSHQTE